MISMKTFVCATLTVMSVCAVVVLSALTLTGPENTLLSLFVLLCAFTGVLWYNNNKRKRQCHSYCAANMHQNVELRSSEDKPPPYEAAISEVPPYEVVIMQMNCKSNTTTEETNSQAERSPLTAEDEVATLTRVSQGHDPDLPTYQEATALTISTEV